MKREVRKGQKSEEKEEIEREEDRDGKHKNKKRKENILKKIEFCSQNLEFFTTAELISDLHLYIYSSLLQ